MISQNSPLDPIIASSSPRPARPVPMTVPVYHACSLTLTLSLDYLHRRVSLPLSSARVRRSRRHLRMLLVLVLVRMRVMRMHMRRHHAIPIRAIHYHRYLMLDRHGRRRKRLSGGLQWRLHVQPQKDHLQRPNIRLGISHRTRVIPNRVEEGPDSLPSVRVWSEGRGRVVLRG